LIEIGQYKSTFIRCCGILYRENNSFEFKEARKKKEGFKMKDIFSNIEQQIENIDAKIEGIVQDATDSKNYEKLNQKINDMVNSSTSAFEKGYARAEKVVSAQAEKFKSSFEGQKEQVKNHTEEFKKASQPAKPAKKDLFANKDGSGGTALMVVGIVFSSITLLGIFTLLILSWVPIAGGIFAIINRFILLPVLSIFIIMIIGGVMMKGRGARFKKYIQVLNGKMQAEISSLARAVNKTENFVRRDLKRMINSNWFKQGSLTADQQTLIVCQGAYEEYQTTKQRTFEAQHRQEEIQRMHDQLPAQAREIIQKGEDFIKEIHGNKVAISEYDLTIKLSHLESILKKIFKRVEKHPEVVPQMRKMMDYYLPTTIKLLQAYVQLDKQAIQGVNILSAKTEIEGSIDTLTLAYEKLLDDLFEDIMLDVSTDISVLNTMLAQDGLTNGDFENMNKRGAE